MKSKSLVNKAIAAGVIQRKPPMPAPKQFTDKKKALCKNACRRNNRKG